ncbi:MAG TPA: tRNA (adenosine(37)-N6)-dimethylallyltransferase MiaA [Acidimicrobiales bacterium]|nr:tRNA (adenosine(37)-N6)-dimethylallyltransferase MiaA [Acidimicrobiales bacterium]
MSARHLVLVGPTASGKSALAMEVARRLGDVELVSADSMQVYRGMDVGTAKPTPAEQEEVIHHLLDLADPAEDYSVARFQADAAVAIAGIERRGHRALVVGGTGLYVQAIVDGLALPGEWPELKAELESEPVERLHRRLAEVDPLAASRIEPGNRRRLVRALEVTLGSGRPFSSFGPGLDAYPPTRFRPAGVWLPRPVLAERIAARYRVQLENGFLDEVRRLQAHMSRTARQALGYRELLEHLTGACTLDEAVAAATSRTRRFARRQRAWFRRDPRITWLGAPGNPVDLLPALLGDWSLP